MLGVFYGEWYAVGTNCTFNSSFPPTTYVSGKAMVIEEASTCGYDIMFEYASGTTSANAAIAATNQTVSIFSDDAVISAFSAFALAGAASIFL